MKWASFRDGLVFCYTFPLPQKKNRIHCYGKCKREDSDGRINLPLSLAPPKDMGLLSLFILLPRSSHAPLSQLGDPKATRSSLKQANGVFNKCVTEVHQCPRAYAQVELGNHVPHLSKLKFLNGHTPDRHFRSSVIHRIITFQICEGREWLLKQARLFIEQWLYAGHHCTHTVPLDPLTTFCEVGLLMAPLCTWENWSC